MITNSIKDKIFLKFVWYQFLSQCLYHCYPYNSKPFTIFYIRFTQPRNWKKQTKNTILQLSSKKFKLSLDQILSYANENFRTSKFESFKLNMTSNFYVEFLE
jgi:hypothetical protein